MNEPAAAHLLVRFDWAMPDAPDADGDTYADSALEDLTHVVGRPAWIRGRTDLPSVLFGSGMAAC